MCEHIELYYTTVTTARNDPRVNSHNRVMLQNWRADFQIVDVTACARYLAKYIAKSEPRSTPASDPQPFKHFKQYSHKSNTPITHKKMYAVGTVSWRKGPGNSTLATQPSSVQLYIQFLLPSRQQNLDVYAHKHIHQLIKLFIQQW